MTWAEALAGDEEGFGAGCVALGPDVAPSALAAAVAACLPLSALAAWAALCLWQLALQPPPLQVLLQQHALLLLLLLLLL